MIAVLLAAFAGDRRDVVSFGDRGCGLEVKEVTCDRTAPVRPVAGDVLVSSPFLVAPGEGGELQAAAAALRDGLVEPGPHAFYARAAPRDPDLCRPYPPRALDLNACPLGYCRPADLDEVRCGSRTGSVAPPWNAASAVVVADHPMPCTGPCIVEVRMEADSPIPEFDGGTLRLKAQLVSNALAAGTTCSLRDDGWEAYRALGVVIRSEWSRCAGPPVVSRTRILAERGWRAWLADPTGSLTGQ